MGEDHSESLAAAVAQAVHVAEQGDDSTERLLALAPTPGAYNEFLDAYADILGAGEGEWLLVLISECMNEVAVDFFVCFTHEPRSGLSDFDA